MQQEPTLAPRLVACLPLCIIGGKLAFGPLADRHSSKFIAAHLLLMSLLMFWVSASRSFASFALCWAGVDFLFGGAFGACVAVVQRSWSEEQRPHRLGLVGASTRFATMASLYVFPMLVARGWELNGFHRLAAGLLGSALACWIAIMPRILERQHLVATLTDAKAPGSAAASADQLPSETMARMLRRVTPQSSFWLLLLSRACSMCLMGCSLHLPAFLIHIAKAGLDAQHAGSGSVEQAASAASLFGAGGLAATLLGGRLFGHLRGPGQGRKLLVGASLVAMFGACASMYSKAVGSVAGLGGQVAVDAAGLVGRLPVTACVFAVGCGVSFLHYIVSQTLLNDLAGRHHIASLTNLCDALGFALLGPFQGLSTHFGQQGDWRFYTGAMTAMTLGACALMALPLSGESTPSGAAGVRRRRWWLVIPKAPRDE